ncbi:sulfate adenylyltransferase [Candidatus Pacearchaeota archaeon CG_4_10_14_0_2_um_filter_05_32_18]|nr:MAG: sulfate adenylyltransferase [Candidatus Pacearchaeota archaeon CG_4_10_14_0_2_um_filter_05_32_18]
MDKDVKIIATIGPGSNNPEILEKLKDRGVDFFRINLSHTDENDIEAKIKDILGYGVPIILDTEGSQVRTGNSYEIEFPEGKNIKLHAKETNCDSSNLFLRPIGIISNLRDGDLISLEFNSVLLRVVNDSTLKQGYIECQVAMGGKIGGKKAVQIQSPTFSLPPFSKKDHLAVELAKKYGIKHFTLSFMEAKSSVEKFRLLYPEAVLYSKIESKKGLDNFMEIAEVSDGVLIDRGDLSSQVPLEKIPFVQKFIIKKVTEIGKEAFVATNTLEQMALALKPNKAEVNDIINTILDGATGIALTKETAVGKYPVETVNMLSNLISQVKSLKLNGSNLIESIEKTNYIYSENTPELLIKPHGGKLVNRFAPDYAGIIPEKRIEIDEESLMDIEQIAVGAFSPLEGFIGSKDFHSITDNYRLSNGVVWPLPIVLSVDEEKRKELLDGEDIALTFNGEVYAILHLNEIYEVEKEKEAEKIFGTNNLEHPGVKKFMGLEQYFLGGKITLLKRRPSIYKVHELTPKQTRKIFSERGWSKIVGFHTRNVIHKSHEFIQLEGMKRGMCDGLFVHPVIGKKKKGDFEAGVIIESYEKMIEDFYPKSKVVMGTFASYSRYCGPREALFTALVRKNFGCSHFIVGRDHTGVGNFYHPNASHEIFNNFSNEDLGLIPIKFDKVFYSEIEEKHIHEPDFIDHPEKSKLHISGTQAREMLQGGNSPPDWFMRPEISKIIIDKIKNGEKVFVE